MAYRVAWTESAWQELEAAAEYIARDSPHFASALIHEAQLKAASYLSVPETAINDVVGVDVTSRYILIQHEGRSDLFRRSGELLQTWHTGARLRLFN